MRIHASDDENTDSEDEKSPLSASGTRHLRHPERPIFENEPDLSETKFTNENPNEED